ncbi:MAG: peptidase M14 [Alphaproteobacteria bacterium]|nr:peptidase M14 [Alphaproteobacteria bacterium]
MADLTLAEITLDQLPDRLLTLAPTEIRRVFPDPTLIHMPGGKGQPVFLSLLLHGNETTSFFVLQRLARWLRSHAQPRPLLIFVGNVHATEAGKRHLDGQPDFNRVWNGGNTPTHHLAQRVLDRIKAARPFAAIDIHNNTGTNPFYGCINALSPDFLHLGALFGPTLVYFRNPPSVITMALCDLCPAITVEAGKPGEAAGIERAFDLVLDTLHLQAFRTKGLERDVKVFHTVGRMEIEDSQRFGFSPSSDAPLLFPEAMDHWNFCPKQAGERFAQLSEAGQPLRVFNAAREDITARFFERRPDGIYLTRDITPSMITLDSTIIRDDCFGYLMEEVEIRDQHEIRAAI